MKLSIELFFTVDGQLKKFELDWFEGMCIQDVLDATHYPTPPLHGIGIFGKKVGLDTLVQPGDRVEIYQALQIDPKEARRQRASRKSKS